MIEILLCVIAALLLLLCVGVWFGAVFLVSETIKRRAGKVAEEDGEAAQREKEERERQEQAFQAGLHAIMNYSYEDALRGARRE